MIFGLCAKANVVGPGQVSKISFACLDLGTCTHRFFSFIQLSFLRGCCPIFDYLVAGGWLGLTFKGVVFVYILSNPLTVPQSLRCTIVFFSWALHSTGLRVALRLWSAIQNVMSLFLRKSHSESLTNFTWTKTLVFGSNCYEALKSIINNLSHDPGSPSYWTNEWMMEFFCQKANIMKYRCFVPGGGSTFVTKSVLPPGAIILRHNKLRTCFRTSRERQISYLGCHTEHWSWKKENYTTSEHKSDPFSSVAS